MGHGNLEKSNRNYSIASAVICLCFLVFSFVFLVHMIQKNELENIQYLNNAARQNKATILKQVQGDFQTLEGLAVFIGESGITDSEKIMQILRKINDENTFIRMGFADVKGNLDLVDVGGARHLVVNLSEHEFFQRALMGEQAISDTLEDTLEPGYQINYYAIQVSNDAEEVTGVLCAVNSSEVLQEIIDAPLLNGEGFSNIIDQEGSLVVASSKNPENWQVTVPLSDHIAAVDEKDDIVDFTMQVEGKAQLGVMQPLGINGWQVVSLIPQSVLRTRYIQTAIGTVVMIFLSAVIFSLLLNQQRVIMEQDQKVLMNLAYRDPLTGCRNFTRFKKDVEKILKEEKADSFVFWYCDLKKFKFFNDRFGYDKGDEVLRRMAGMIEEFSGEETVSCRVSADNFAGIRRYKDQEELVEWFHNLLTFLHRGEEELGNSLHFDVCMGFYCMTGEDWRDSVDALVNRANMAQKSVKSLPGSNYAFYNKEISNQAIEETELEAAADNALKNGELKLYLQPKVDIQNGNRIEGAEVLVRWEHPSKGMIPPDKFIPILERNGMVVRLDRYMFEHACEWFHGYLSEERPTIHIAVNVSRMGLLQEDFVDYYAMVKDRFRIPNGLIELEFTESMVLADDELFLKTVLHMQEHGFICSMDDFGSGYSSLNLLKNLPINVLKLDILFFRNSSSVKRERIVISHVINMARELKIKTVAEGVESLEMVDFLRNAGCNIIQGYVFARPMPLADYDNLLRSIGDRPFTPQA